MTEYSRTARYTVEKNAPLVIGKANGVMLQGENLADVLEITITDGGVPVDLSGIASAVAMVTNVDGQTVRNPGTVSEIIRIALQGESYAVPGPVTVEVQISAGSLSRTILVIKGRVEQNSTGVLLDPSGEIPSYEDLVVIMQELQVEIESARAATERADAAAGNANEKAAEATEAAGAANVAAGNAEQRASEAGTAATEANEAARKIDGMTVSAEEIAAGGQPTAQISETEGHKHIAFGIPKGDKGDIGQTPRMTIGTVTTAEPTANATATLTGTEEAPVLNLRIPRGYPGEGAVDAVDGVIPQEDGNVALGAVRYSGSQEMSQSQRRTARENVGALGTDDVVNSLTQTETGKALDAVQGKALNEKIEQKTSTMAQTVQIPAAGWSAAENGVEQWIGVENAMADEQICQIVISYDPESKEAFEKHRIEGVEQGDGRIRFRAKTAPEEAFPIRVMIHRTNADFAGQAGMITVAETGTENILRFGKKLQTETALSALVVYGKTTDGQALGSGGTITMRVTNKNMLPWPYDVTEGTTTGVNVEVLEDGAVHIAGTNSGSTMYVLFASKWLPPEFAQNVTLSDCTKHATNGNYYYRVGAGETVDVTLYPQAEYGAEATPFVKPVAAQTVTISVGDGLRSVENDAGNYTDENGTVWLCDTVEYDRATGTAKIVRRVAQTGEALELATEEALGESEKAAIEGLLLPRDEPTIWLDGHAGLYAECKESGTALFEERLAKVEGAIAKLKGKTIAVMGDSISSTSYTRPVWWEMIAEKTGAEVLDYGVPGSTLASIGDGTGVAERVGQMDATADCVVVMAGTNDNSTTKGAWSGAENTTFYGALDAILLELLEKMPGKAVLLCTPIQRANSYGTNVEDAAGELKQKADGSTLTLQLRAEAIRRKGAQYGVPVLDLYNTSGINGVDESHVYYRTNDNLHPSETGMKRIAALVREKLEAMLWEVEA